uniref:Uncharacterized protein n=1 Tax=Avena sativa TaxID=4498 RepID=A0ACD5VWR8_AVESA
MLKQTNSYFCVFHLVRLVFQGKWTQALGYIFPRFLPLEPCWTPSLEARVLVKFLRVHQLFQSEVRSKFPGNWRAMNWRAMWAKAAKIVLNLANSTPEFKDRLLLPDGLMGPQNVLPIGFGFAPFRRKRQVKDHTRPREEHNRRMAYTYVKKRMSVPSSSHCSQELSPEIIDKQRDDWFVRIFEECIKAATCLELNQGSALQSSAREGDSVTGNFQPQTGDRLRPETQTPVPNHRRPSKMMTRTRAMVCGQELQLFVPGEYPCVRRLRYRRLLAFLRLQGYASTFVAMLKRTDYYFCVFHLARLMSQGLWDEALDYIFPRFLPLEPCSPPSLEATVLVKFLRVHRLFHLEVASKISRDWKPMWARAARIVQDLANTIPEFKDRLQLPDSLMGPQDILPIGFGFAPFRRRRHVKKCTRPTSKHAGEELTRRIANNYFDKRMSLPSSSSSHCRQELSPEIAAKARDDWFGRIFARKIP